MSDVAIRVEGLGKKYRLGANAGPSYKTVRESLIDAGKGPLRKLARVAGKRPEDGQRGHRPEFWALKDVSFEVKRGEVLGVIGRNGAGKSTLLKILSQITEPTEGEVSMKGRVASLLEVGTGFHPELTGRENVYLNGAILGMGKAEIARKFDEIVDFAEVEKFIDTPVKHYSSGMYLRLAFSVAAHLEPEILVVDEVLAVGDAEFQKKCLGKMGEVAGEGRTVLFVSHNMPSVVRLCMHSMLLKDGRLALTGSTGDVTRHYLGSGSGALAVREWSELASAPGNRIVRLRGVRVKDSSGRVTETIDIRQPARIEMEFEVLVAGRVLVPNLHFFNEEGVCVFISNEVDSPWHRRARPVGLYTATAHIPGDFLTEGTLFVRAAISTYRPFEVHVDVRDAVAFRVQDSLDACSARGEYSGFMPGVVRPLITWTTLEAAPPARAGRDSVQAWRE